MAAHLLAREGAEVALFESHSKPGGCASYFGRNTAAGRVVFDAGATVLNQLEGGQFLDRALKSFGIEPPPFEPIRSVRYLDAFHDRPFDVDFSNVRSLVETLSSAFPKDSAALSKELPRLLETARNLMRAFERVPHLPIQNLSDLWANRALVGILRPHTIEFLKGYQVSFGELLESWGFSSELRRWIDMTLLITLQAPASEIHPFYGALALNFYGLGAGSVVGGMRAFFDALLKGAQAHTEMRVFMKTPVLRVGAESDRLWIDTSEGKRLGPFDWIVSSIPRMNSGGLLAEFVVNESLDDQELQKTLWGAFVGYFVVKDRPEWSANAFHLHSSRAPLGGDAPEGGDVYVSVSSRADEARCPQGFRALTTSTHTRLAQWQGARANSEQKLRWGRINIVPHLERAWPGVEIVFEDYGSPRTFERYTRRKWGHVGGWPLTRDFSFFASRPQRTRHPRIFQIGDTSFPGQSVYACTLGACSVVEKILGRKIVV